MNVPEIREDQLIYPPTGEVCYRVDTLEDVVGLTLLDYTNFHRLFIDKEDGIKYVYKVKNPKSHIDELIRIQNESN